MKILRFITFFAVVLSLSAQCVMAGPVHELVTSFDAPPNYFRGNLVLGPDSYYWGTSERGGLYGIGTIFKVKSDGSDWQTVISFTSNGVNNKGSHPTGSLVRDGAYLWGTTQYGGANNRGTLFKIRADTSVLTTLVSFTGNDSTNKGSNPYSELLSDGAGFFWGTTLNGGANDDGTIFKINASSGALTTVVSFTSSGTNNKGNAPYAGLVSDGSGFFWGTTLYGGASNCGTAFKINTITGQLTTVIEFSNNGTTNKGRSPYAGLVKDEVGFFWGTTASGGANDLGTLFKINASSGVLTTLVEFSGNGTINKGSLPYARLISDGAGAFWGTASSGGANGGGTVFKISADTGTLVTLVNFTGNGANDKGSSTMAGLVNDGAGSLLGVTRYGGAGNYGTVFKINVATGVLTTLVDFTSSSKIISPYAGLVSDGAGSLWGTTKEGGASGYGSIFKVNIDTGVPTTVVNFSNNGSSDKGSDPVAGLVNDGAGVLWGTTQNGGASNYGTIFKINVSTGIMTTLVQFTGNGASNKGSDPMSELVRDGVGYLWGTTYGGGANNRGTVFKINVNTGVLNTVVEFTGNGVSNKGAYPYSGLVADGVGYFWGTTSEGGANDHGTVFKIHISSGQLTTAIEFTENGPTNKGRYPWAGLVKDDMGFFWGTTPYGGTNGYGTVFKVDTASGTLTTQAEFTIPSSPNIGPYPTARMVDDGAGFLWGTTEWGGLGLNDGYGTVFKINKGTGVLTTVIKFTGDGSQTNNGMFPRRGSLFKHTDGHLYGTTSEGGPGNKGTIFRLRRGPKAITQPVSERTGTKATLNASVNPNNDGNTAVNYQYGTSSTLSGATTVSAGTVVNTSSVSQVSLQISGLRSASLKRTP